MTAFRYQRDLPSSQPPSSSSSSLSTTPKVADDRVRKPAWWTSSTDTSMNLASSTLPPPEGTAPTKNTAPESLWSYLNTSSSASRRPSRLGHDRSLLQQQQQQQQQRQQQSSLKTRGDGLELPATALTMTRRPYHPTWPPAGIKKAGESDWILEDYDPEKTEPPDLEKELFRLQVLKKYPFLHQKQDPALAQGYQRCTDYASQLFHMPVAGISLIDLGRTLLLATTGMDGFPPEVPRKSCFCAHAVLCRQSAFVVSHASRENRYQDSPYVCGPRSYTQFFAGAPLITPEGAKIGTLFVLDNKPRTWTSTKTNMLVEIAAMVMNLMNEDRAQFALQQQQQQVPPSLGFHAENRHHLQHQSSTLHLQELIVEIEQSLYDLQARAEQWSQDEGSDSNSGQPPAPSERFSLEQKATLQAASEQFQQVKNQMSAVLPPTSMAASAQEPPPLLDRPATAQGCCADRCDNMEMEEAVKESDSQGDDSWRPSHEDDEEEDDDDDDLLEVEDIRPEEVEILAEEVKMPPTVSRDPIKMLAELPEAEKRPPLVPRDSVDRIGQFCRVHLLTLVKNLEFAMDGFHKHVPLIFRLDSSLPETLFLNDLRVFRSSMALLTSACQRTERGHVLFSVGPYPSDQRVEEAGGPESLLFECEDSAPVLPHNFLQSPLTAQSTQLSMAPKQNEQECIQVDPVTGQIHGSSTCLISIRRNRSDPGQLEEEGADNSLAVKTPSVPAAASLVQLTGRSVEQADPNYLAARVGLQTVAEYLHSVGGVWGFRRSEVGNIFWFRVPLRIS